MAGGFVLEDGTPIEPVSTGGGFVLEDGTPIKVDTAPSWRESAYQVAKDLGEGATMAPAALLGLFADAGQSAMRMMDPLRDSKTSIFQLNNTRKFAGEGRDFFDWAAGVPEGSPDVVEGTAQDFSKAVLQSVPYPGGPIVNALSGLGAEAAHKALPNSAAAPLVGGTAAAIAPSLISNLFGAIRHGIKGATQQEIKGSAARAFKEQTGLTPEAIAAAQGKLPEDKLASLMSTAEVTGNAGAAQLEKVLASKGENANAYAKRAAEREAAREGVLSETSQVPAVNKEGLGTKLITAANKQQAAMERQANQKWSEVPRDVPIDVGPEQDALLTLLEQKQAGLGPTSPVRTLIEQFVSQDPRVPALSSTRTSGALQDIRSDSLRLLRDSKLNAIEERSLSNLQDGIDSAMERGLAGEDYSAWSEARKLTAREKKTFARGTAGGALTEEMARPANALANALKGDSRSIKELHAAIGKNPKLIEEVKRGVLDSIPRDASGNLTAGGMNKFIQANKSGLEELFGKDHYKNISRVLEDLRSEANVGKTGFLASKGNSITSQRSTVAGAITDIMTEAVMPGSAIVGKIADAIKKAANIKDTTAVEELLFRASLDPDFAVQLAGTPTNTRILNVFQRLGQTVKAAAVDTAQAGAVQNLRDETSDQQRGWQRLGEAAPAEARSSKLGSQGSKVSSSNSTTPKNTTQNGLLGPIRSLFNGTGSIFKGKSMSSDGVSEPIVKAVISQESGGNAKAVSDAGAQGLMQILPSTAAEIAKDLGMEDFDLKDPQTNVKIGTEYLRRLLKEFGGDIELALTAYHSGPNRVKSLLARAKGSKLADIKKYLGPVGQKYAAQVLGRLSKA